MGALEMLVVALIVLVSILYSAWRLTSARLHLRAIDLLGSVLGNSPGGWVARLRGRALSQLSGGCGTCASNVKLKAHGPGPGSA
jgi:hypothetical protein